MVKQAESFVDMFYAPPDRHAQVNGYAELACKSVEVCIKSLLMERNLPPSFWQMCAADAEFLLNRFPVMSDDIAVPVDGDRALPIELLTRGQYSRRMSGARNKTAPWKHPTWKSPFFSETHFLI